MRPAQDRSVLDADGLDVLAALLHKSGPDVRRMFAACDGADDQLQFLIALRDFQRDPDDRKVLGNWKGWVNHLRQT